MKYQQLLLALDLQHDATHLIQRAAKLAQRLDAELILLSVIPSVVERESATTSVWQLKQQGIDYLTHITSALPCHIRRYQIEAGDVVLQLQCAVRELHPDLVLLGHRHMTGFLSGLHNTLVAQLLPTAGVDILLLDEDASFWSSPLHFTVALGLEEADFALLLRANALARELDAQLTVVHVVEPLAEAHLAIELEQSSMSWLTAALDQAEHKIADWMARLPTSPPRWRVQQGEAAVVLQQHLEQTRDALLIMGAGQTGHHHLTTGAHLAQLLKLRGDLLIMQ